MHTDFDDLRDDNRLFARPDATPAPTDTSPVIYTEVCRKCGGSGRYNAPSSLGHQICLQCKGTGRMEYRRSALERQRFQERRVARKAASAQASASSKLQEANAWLAAHPNEAAWLETACKRGFGFAERLQQGLQQFGHMTEGQLVAIRKCMVDDEQRAAARAASGNAAFQVDMAQIEKAFARATDTTSGMALKRPKLRLGRYMFSLAPATGRNAGSIYVKRCADGETEQEYLGKITQGKLFPTGDCTPEDKQVITEVASKPREAAEKYGRLTGRCAICNRALEKGESVDRGIGPTCAERFGFL